VDYANSRYKGKLYNEISGYPAPSKTDTNAKKVTEIVRSDCNFIVWKVAEELNINKRN
jgi:hypothetical protein